MSKNMNPTKVIVPCRFSYLHCWEPDSVNGGDPKYSVSAIIPKSDTKTINAIKAAVEQAKKDSVSKWGGKIPANLKLPLRDGDIDRPDDEAYANSYFFNAEQPSGSAGGGFPCTANSGSERSILRLLWKDQRDILWIQLQREPWDCCRTW